MSVELALDELRRVGWSLFSGTLDELRIHGQREGWIETPIRRGDPPITEIRPADTSDAHPASMSATVGLGAQPLHTDGAHLTHPPDIVALEVDSPRAAATRLFVTLSGDQPSPDLRNGVFRVSAGRGQRHQLAIDAERLRFDPCCMFPLDHRSRRVVRYFDAALNEAHRHRWQADSSEVLLIDNTRTLHAREAINPGGAEAFVRRLPFRIPGPS